MVTTRTASDEENGQLLEGVAESELSSSPYVVPYPVINVPVNAHLVNYNRLLLQNITLSDGTMLPSGVMISVAGAARSNDPDHCVSPERTDPLRYHKVSGGQTRDDNNNQFTSIAQGDSWFGYGRQACPGRWFAEAQIKLILASLILNYNIEFPKNQSKRPPNIHADDKILPDNKQEIVFRKLI